jgi:hypothetical protein
LVEMGKPTTLNTPLRMTNICARDGARMLSA